MWCPRCDSRLTVYAIDDAETAAVVCEPCGFADITASHHREETRSESWAVAVERFETLNGGSGPPVQQTDRTDAVSLPDVPADERTTIEDSLTDTGVSVGVSVESRETDSAERPQDTDPDDADDTAQDRTTDSPDADEE